MQWGIYISNSVDLILLCRVKGCISIFFAVDGKMWNSDKSASCYCLYRYIDLYFWDHHWLSLLIHDEGGNGSDMLGAVTTPLTSWLEIMMLCHGEGDRQSDTFVSNSHKGYNFIHRHVLLLWTFIAITHFLCCFQSFVEICLQSCCMWGLLHCRLVEISPQSCICQGFCTASLATNELIIKCVGENDPVCLFSNIWKCLRMGDLLLSPWQSKNNLASSFDSSCIPVGLI